MRGLLVRSLRTRWHRLACLADPGAGGTVTDGKDVRVACGLERWQHQKLVGAIGLESIQLGQNIGSLDAGRPHDELCRNEGSVGKLHAARNNFLDARRGMHMDTQSP